MTLPPTEHELRCPACSRQPLLATYGVKDGKLFVHVKVYKQRRVFGEVISYGDVEVRCRDCFRWHKVVVRQPNTAVLREVTGTLPSV